jgi:acetoacetyl-CoA synthetase
MCLNPSGELLPEVEWFVGARVNHAETLLRHCVAKRDKTAVIWLTEHTRTPQSISFGELGRRVARVQAGLISLKFGRGDVAAAVLSNGIEATLLMLAVTASGGVWASLGPDLGTYVIVSRFALCEPKLIALCMRYHYGGKGERFRTEFVLVNNM